MPVFFFLLIPIWLSDSYCWCWLLVALPWRIKILSTVKCSTALWKLLVMSPNGVFLVFKAINVKSINCTGHICHIKYMSVSTTFMTTVNNEILKRLLNRPRCWDWCSVSIWLALVPFLIMCDDGQKQLRSCKQKQDTNEASIIPVTIYITYFITLIMNIDI